MHFFIFKYHARAFEAALVFFVFLDFYLLWRQIKERKEGGGELLARILGSNFFGFYLLYRILLQAYDVLAFPRSASFFSWVQWVLIVLPFAIFFWSYLFRSPARVVANRFREIVFPFFCALLPFGVYESSSLVYEASIQKTSILQAFLTPFFPGGFSLYHSLAMVFIFIGDAMALWALFYLRRSFSIMAEVRDWVNRGPYRWMRHPMYSGEILATIGFCLLKFSYFNLFLTLLFLGCIAWRACIEEQKIKSVYPHYASYQQKVGFFFPKILS